MSNRYFSYSFQIHRTRKTIIIFIIFVVLLVGGFIAFYKSKKHTEKIDRLKYEVVLGMNEFEEKACDKAYKLYYKESTCGSICININNEEKNYLGKKKNTLENNGFTFSKVKTKKINDNTWEYIQTKKSIPKLEYYSFNFSKKLYSVELIDQTEYLVESKSTECKKSFNKFINSLEFK